MAQERDDYAAADLPPPAVSLDDVLVGVGEYAIFGMVLVVLAILLSLLGREVFR
jgi:hypothetical protein